MTWGTILNQVVGFWTTILQLGTPRIVEPTEEQGGASWACLALLWVCLCLLGFARGLLVFGPAWVCLGLLWLPRFAVSA